MALSYTESSTLMTNGSYRGRVKVAALFYAQNLLTQTDPLATGAQLRWAGEVMKQPDTWAQTLAHPTAMDPNIRSADLDPTTGDSTASDDIIQGAVEAVANRLM